jgi:nitric oxide reductase large subunit
MKRNTSWLLVTRNRLVSLTGRFGAWPNLVSGGMVTLRICLTAKKLCQLQNGRHACCDERTPAVELKNMLFSEIWLRVTFGNIFVFTVVVYFVYLFFESV